MLFLISLIFNRCDHIITMNIRDDLSKIIFKFCIITIATLVPAFADTTQFLSTSGSLQCVDSSQVIRKMRCNPSLTGCYFDCQQISNCTHVAVKSLKDISECYLIQSSPIESLVTKESYREALLLTALTQGGGKDLHSGHDLRPLVFDTVTLGLTDFGNWSHHIFCPLNSKVTGLRIRVQPDSGSGDDTGLNSVQLACSDGSMTNTINGHYGYWLPWQMCNTESDPIYPDMFIKEFGLLSEPPQGSGDDTGANNIKLTCNNEKVLVPQSTPWGYWKSGKCPDHTYLCGVQAKMDERTQTAGLDVSGMNRLKFICCC